jgi:DNA repair exonuclease SbcCD nuclease subunit
MVIKIVHLSDIHLRKAPTRNGEYEKVFDNLIKSIAKQKPDRIVIVGDLFHDYLDLQSEQLITANWLLNRLAQICKVIITRGNHDCRKKNLKRVDSVRAIVETLNKNPNVVYYDKTGFYYDENIVWAVWHHGEQKNNPWKTNEGKIYEKLKNTSVIQDENGNWTKPQYTAIDLFHDPVNGCKSITGFEMKSKSFYKINDFKGDFSFFGDIHRQQFLNKEHTKAYCGSLIAQDIDEGDDNFHGYLLWDIINKTVEEIPIYNEYSFKNIKITPYTDFDDLDYEIPNPTEYMRIRFVWNTLPQTRNKENERKLAYHYKNKYGNIIISHINQFVETDKINVSENITLENINNIAVQHKIYREYLEKIGVDNQLIEDILVLDIEISSDIDMDDISNIEWNIIKFGGTNFMSYEKLDIDWRDMDGLFQITGVNTAGKTTIMKLISYILFGKTLETEIRMKFGDSRFVNNRNSATYCDGYLVFEANGEYYGIKKRTEIKKDDNGSINGASTTLNYYILSNPDEPMDSNTLLDKIILDEDRRSKTQKKINTIIGSYDNFMRIVMTTSDTLNRILSNDMAVFIDSLLYDSGLDIFDKKLENLKVYQKKINEKNRIVCDVIKTIELNKLLQEEIDRLEAIVYAIEVIKIPEIQVRIKTGRTYVETLSKKLFKIDPGIYDLKVDNVINDINSCQKNIDDYNVQKSVLINSIESLKENYDEKRFNLLLNKKEFHRAASYNKKLNIRTIEQEIREEEHKIEIINGEIFRLKQDGAKLRNKINELAKSKICPTCGQSLSSEHRVHIDTEIVKIKNEMFDIADIIKQKEKDIDLTHQSSIVLKQKDIDIINESVVSSTLEMEEVLKEIGELSNDKNDVEKRRELQLELDQIPIKIQNEELKISLFQQKINNYNNSLLQIEENKKIEAGISAAKTKLKELEIEEQEHKENIFINKTLLGDKSLKIKANNELMVVYKEQEYRDSVINLYKKCVHRDGIPRQILVNYIVPKINLTLEKILSVAQFKVWLDLDDLRLKLAYNSRPTAIIDCFSASGKERTFSSIVLKFSLNQINVKAKPMMFLLDEVMGKFDLEGSVEEFIGILHSIKNYMKKTLVIEHIHEIDPDYLINVELIEGDISVLSIG